MNPQALLNKYYPHGSNAHRIITVHSELVTRKALAVCSIHPELQVDLQFIKEAAMLHDIGICKTNAPDIGCFGDLPYICHGYMGHDILVSEGYPRHGFVCERHTGTGLSLHDIITSNLPLPHREMLPISIEEIIICYADKFFSKSRVSEELTVDKIVKNLSKYGQDKVDLFLSWHAKYQ